MKKSLGIYLHIPFCLKKCHYCDFCSFPGSGEERMRDYVRELCRRMRRDLPDPNQWRVDTVYLGGGTPTLLPLDCFERILEVLRTSTDLSADAEITCECNPATASLSLLFSLRELGVDRLSIGLQSIHDRELVRLGRAHTYADFLKTFEDARRAGFDNISADLMYGLPESTFEDFRDSLEALATIAPEHISAYGLKIEEGTLFDRQRDQLILPDEETEFQMYCAMTEILSAHGYRKYEISNFAKENRASRHNLRYWQRADYLGFGVAAHSCFEGVRFGNSRDMAGFLDGKDITEERYVLSEREELEEWIMLGLRLSQGLDEKEWGDRLGAPPDQIFPALRDWIAAGYLARRDGRIFFTDRGFFVSNAILSRLLDFPQKNC